ncbi:MAG TPA: hypothetical protein VLC09_19365 [Polyangiaceae bacterium]|nr:hypothetical protein [Polyangiaceae bacterium]
MRVNQSIDQVREFRTRVAEPNCAELRCLCGSLLARLVPGGVELKCRRCKRAVVIPLSTE